MDQLNAAAAPINVDVDSDATLSSDAEMEEEDSSHAVRSVAPKLRTHAAAEDPPAPSSPNGRFLASLDGRRAELRQTAPLGDPFDRFRASISTSPAVASTSFGKKRRLSPSPPRANGGKKQVTSSLDFRLDSTPSRLNRTIQSVDDDEDDGDQEEKASKPLEVVSSLPFSAVSISRIKAARTWICGQWFGQCKLNVYAIYMEMSLWSLPTNGLGYGAKMKFHGSIGCSQLNRFSVSGGKAPFYAILQLTRGETTPSFGQFYDSIFAQVTEHAGPSMELDIYGAVLFFDDELELARCKSLSDISPGLRKVMDTPVSNEEAAQVLALRRPDISSSSNGRQQSPPASPRASTSTSVMSTISGKVKGTLNALSSLFSSDRNSPPTAKLRQTKLTDADASDQESGTMSTQFRTSLRRKSLLQQQARDNVEVVVQLSGDTDNDAAIAEELSRGERRSTRAALKQQREQQKTELERISAERKSKVLLMYPFDCVDRIGQITINFGDMERLKPGEFLNDSIIDFYLRFFWRHIKPWQQSLAYFFSSHFFTQLSGGRLSGPVSLPEDRYTRIARWTQKEDLFEKRFIFVPINDSCHWSIAVICNPGSAIVRKRRRKHAIDRKPALPPTTVFDVDDPHDAIVIDTTEDADDEEEEDDISRQERMERPPCILFLDSLRCHQKKKICSLLKTYLQYEYKTRFENTKTNSSAAEDSLITSFDMDSIQLIEPDIPLQTNSSDCGVYLLMYSAQIIQRLPDGVNQEHIASKFASSLSRGIFDDTHVREFRDYLHQLVFTLQRIEKRGGSEDTIRKEGLEFFVVDT